MTYLKNHIWPGKKYSVDNKTDLDCFKMPKHIKCFYGLKAAKYPIESPIS